MESSDWDEVAQAVRDLGEVSPTTESQLATLLSKTEHQVAQVRQAAVEGLGKAAGRGDRKIVERLATMVHTECDSLVRDATLYALASCALQGSPEGECALSRLLPALKSNEWDERWQAAEALSSHLDTSLGLLSFCKAMSSDWEDLRSSGIAALLRAVNDEYAEVRAAGVSVGSRSLSFSVSLSLCLPLSVSVSLSRSVSVSVCLCLFMSLSLSLSLCL